MALTDDQILVATGALTTESWSAANIRALLDLEIGTDVQAQNALLQAIATAGTLTDGSVLIGNAAAVPQAVALATGQLLVGQAAGDPLAKTISGDTEVSADGVVTYRHSIATRSYYYQDFLGAALPSEFSSVVSTGSTIAITAAASNYNGIVEMSCDDDAADYASFSLAVFQVSKNPRCQWYVKDDTPTNYYRSCVGFHAGFWSQPAWFTCKADENSGNWVCRSKDSGGTEEATNTAVSSTSYHLLDIRIVSATSVTFYIDGALQATHTTRVPSGDQFAGAYVLCTGATTGAHKFYIDAMSVEANR